MTPLFPCFGNEVVPLESSIGEQQSMHNLVQDMALPLHKREVVCGSAMAENIQLNQGSYRGGGGVGNWDLPPPPQIKKLIVRPNLSGSQGGGMHPIPHFE